MKTTELFSMAVIVKDLGLVLVRLSSILQKLSQIQDTTNRKILL